MGCSRCWRKWVGVSGTSGAKVGESCRWCVRSVCVGIEPIVKLAEGNSAVINWHLNGFKKATSDVRLYLALVAAAARPSEALLLELMEDDRLLLHADKYWEVLVDELKYLLDAPLSVWQSIAGVLQVSADDLRRWVVDATVTSIGYLWMDIWRRFSQVPWKYATGDARKKNVEDLKVAPPAAERTSSKLQLLAQGGFEHEVVKGLELLKEAAMTTVLLEQAHASAAQLMRRHQQFGY
mgnify:CR=1 FL=1